MTKKDWQELAEIIKISRELDHHDGRLTNWISARTLIANLERKAKEAPDHIGGTHMETDQYVKLYDKLRETE